jgi:hypothetical protein
MQAESLVESVARRMAGKRRNDGLTLRMDERFHISKMFDLLWSQPVFLFNLEAVNSTARFHTATRLRMVGAVTSFAYLFMFFTELILYLPLSSAILIKISGYVQEILWIITVKFS